MCEGIGMPMNVVITIVPKVLAKVSMCMWWLEIERMDQNEWNRSNGAFSYVGERADSLLIKPL